MKSRKIFLRLQVKYCLYILQNDNYTYLLIKLIIDEKSFGQLNDIFIMNILVDRFVR